MLCLLSDSMEISLELFPLIMKRIEEKFEKRGSKLLNEFSENFSQLLFQLKSTFCELRANYISKKKLKWKADLYKDENALGFLLFNLFLFFSFLFYFFTFSFLFLFFFFSFFLNLFLTLIFFYKRFIFSYFHQD